MRYRLLARPNYNNVSCKQSPNIKSLGDYSSFVSSFGGDPGKFRFPFKYIPGTPSVQYPSILPCYYLLCFLFVFLDVTTCDKLLRVQTWSTFQPLNFEHRSSDFTERIDNRHLCIVTAHIGGWLRVELLICRPILTKCGRGCTLDIRD